MNWLSRGRMGVCVPVLGVEWKRRNLMAVSKVGSGVLSSFSFDCRVLYILSVRKGSDEHHHVWPHPPIIGGYTVWIITVCHL